jgi:hypothetical protein
VPGTSIVYVTADCQRDSHAQHVITRPEPQKHNFSTQPLRRTRDPIPTLRSAKTPPPSLSTYIPQATWPIHPNPTPPLWTGALAQWLPRLQTAKSHAGFCRLCGSDGMRTRRRRYTYRLRHQMEDPRSCGLPLPARPCPRPRKSPASFPSMRQLVLQMGPYLQS